MKAFYLFIAFLFVACGSSRQATTPPVVEVRPDWVESRPIDAGYYIGIGVARKSASSFDHIELAKRNALNDLVSQITVTVQANSVQSQLERNRVFSDEFRSFTKLTSTVQLETYEVVATWQNANEYWVYYRLSAAEYQRQKQQKMDQAKRLAMDHFEKAQTALAEGRPGEGLGLHIRALETIKAYLNEPLETNIAGKEVYLGNELIASMARSLREISIRANPKRVQAKAAHQVQEEITVKVVRADTKNSPMANFPLKIRFSQGNGTIVGGSTTDDQGILKLRIGHIGSKEAIQEILIEADLETMLRNQPNYKLWLSAVDPQALPQERIQLEVSRPTVFIASREVKLNGDSVSTQLQNAIRRRLLADGFQTTNDAARADFICQFSAQTRKGTVNNGMFTVLLDAQLTLIDKVGNERYSQKLSNLRGVQLDFDKAEEAVLKRAATDLETSVIPKLSKSIFNQ